MIQKLTHPLGRLLLLLVVSALLMGAAIAADPGSEGDPLVTLSYLNSVFLPKVEQLAREQAGGGSSAGNFTLVELAPGKKLTGTLGCELLLRVGSATCSAASSPGLIDETDGSVLEHGGALQKNHLYMMTIEDRAVVAGGSTVKLMVRGGYTIQ